MTHAGNIMHSKKQRDRCESYFRYAPISSPRAKSWLSCGEQVIGNLRYQTITQGSFLLSEKSDLVGASASIQERHDDVPVTRPNPGLGATTSRFSQLSTKFLQILAIAQPIRTQAWTAQSGSNRFSSQEMKVGVASTNPANLPVTSINRGEEAFIRLVRYSSYEDPHLETARTIS